MIRVAVYLVPALYGVAVMTAYGFDRVIVKEVLIAAPRDQVWKAWTTESGVSTFFGRSAKIELRPNGSYEVLFFPDNPPGTRGAENTHLLVVEPEQRIVFTWDAPPAWPDIRGQRTVVEVRLEPATPETTTVELRHSGWGQGEDWDAVYRYFEGAWSVVLKRLKYRFEHGVVDWDHMPEELVYRG